MATDAMEACLKFSFCTSQQASLPSRVAKHTHPQPEAIVDAAWANDSVKSSFLAINFQAVRLDGAGDDAKFPTDISTF